MRRHHRQFDFAGSVHFVTTVARERSDTFAMDSIAPQVLKLFEEYRSRLELQCFGYVLMPDHLHALLRQQASGPLISNFMANFKRETSKQLALNDSARAPLWRKEYDDVPIPNRKAAAKRLEYMLNNPVRRGLVDNPMDYLWSSAKEHSGTGNGIVKVEQI